LAYRLVVNFNGEPLIPFVARLLGLLGLILASVGTYGITAYSAARRANEIRAQEMMLDAIFSHAEGNVQ
jgi:hypothetical protein